MSCAFHVVSAATMALWYDMSLHLFGTRQSRNHPVTIIRRFCTVAVNSLLAIFLVFKLFTWMNPVSYTFTETLDAVGVAVHSGNIKTIATSMLVGVGCTLLLYLGEILILILSGELKRLATVEHWRSSFLSLTTWRDIVVGPITEEIVFRGCLIAVLRHGCGNSVSFSILVSSLIFGVAHLHHVAELIIFQGASASQAIQTVGFQIGYSSVFGLYASFLFVKTGHLAGPILAHSLCNWLGIPRLVVLDRDDIEGTEDETFSGWLHRKAILIAKRSLVFVYVIGVLLFLIVLSFLPSPK